MGFEKDYKNIRFCYTVARRTWKMNREDMMLNKQRSQVEKMEDNRPRAEAEPKKEL